MKKFLLLALFSAPVFAGNCEMSDRLSHEPSASGMRVEQQIAADNMNLGDIDDPDSGYAKLMRVVFSARLRQHHAPQIIISRLTGPMQSAYDIELGYYTFMCITERVGFWFYVDDNNVPHKEPFNP